MELKLKITILCLFLWVSATGQKSVIDNNLYKSWKSLKEINANVSSLISGDGRYVIYKYGSRTESILVIQAVNGSYKREYYDVEEAFITCNDRTAILRFSDNRMGILTLGTSHFQSIKDVSSFQIPQMGDGKWLVYQTGGEMKKVVLRNLKNNSEKVYPEVDGYRIDRAGRLLYLNRANSLIAVEVLSGRERRILTGVHSFNIAFDNWGGNAAIVKSYDGISSIYFYNVGGDSVSLIADNFSSGIPKNFLIKGDDIRFSQDGRHVFFYLKDSVLPQQAKEPQNPVNIWSYNDKYLNGTSKPNEGSIMAASSIINPAVVVLNSKDEIPLVSYENGAGNRYILTIPIINNSEFYWNDELFTLKKVSISTGEQNAIVSFKKIYSYPSTSPEGRYIYWFNKEEKVYYTYDNETEKINNISNDIKDLLFDQNNDKIGVRNEFGVLGWLPHDRGILVYDEYDIWKLDPTGRQRPVNITLGQGRKNGIAFRYIGNTKWQEDRIVDGDIIVAAFNKENKENGFFKVSTDGSKLPRKCTMGPYVYYTVCFVSSGGQEYSEDIPQKARDKELYVVRRMSVSESANLFITRDFKKFIPLSNIRPEEEFNWMTSELVKWNLPDGRKSMGILYKPQNFDSTQKYPIIFHYYEKKSDELNLFKIPKLSYGDLNIPWYVSNGYLVFVPDMQYEVGNNLESITNTITSAVDRLKQKQFIDFARMGLQGHSFGGYETLVLLAKTSLFAAAQESAGPSNLITGFSHIGDFGSHQLFYEFGQPNMGISLLENPDVYVKNSPFFYAKNINTPLLIMHNRGDGAVSFNEATELFTALRRQGKHCWLLEYKNEGHVLSSNNNKIDFTSKQQEFFDYYLRSKRAPSWLNIK